MKKLLVLVMVLFLGTVAFGQGTNQADVLYSATVSDATIIELSVGDAIWDALRPGVSYKCIADFPVNNTNITPFIEEAFEPAQIDIVGAPNSDIVLTFILPTILLPDGGVGVITMDYDNQSANWFDDGAGQNNFFNPLSPFTVTMNSDGAAIVLLGGNPTVAENASGGVTFNGYALVTAEYTGMAL